MAKIIIVYKALKKMAFGNEISSSEDEFDFELFRNEIDYIHIYTLIID